MLNILWMNWSNLLSMLYGALSTKCHEITIFCNKISVFCLPRWNNIKNNSCGTFSSDFCWKFPRKMFNDVSQLWHHRWHLWPTFMTSVTHFHDVSTNFCRQIHWYKNTVLTDAFAIELTSLDPNQAYPLDYSGLIYTY